MTQASSGEAPTARSAVRRTVSHGDGVIFLLGLPRSGTTLLQRLLGEHSAVHTVAEPWLMLPLTDLLSSRLAHSDYDSALGAEALASFALELPRGRAEIVDGVRRLAVDLYDSCRRTTGARYFLDKTPRYHYIVPDLHDLLPDAKFIVLRRNPLSVLASVSEAWFGGDVVAALQDPFHHRDLTSGFRHLDAAGPILGDRACSIRYESLVTDTERELRRLCAFLEIEFEPAMLRYDPNARFKGSFGDSIGVPRHREASPGSLDKWQGTILQPHNAPAVARFVRDTPATSFAAAGLDRDALLDELETWIARHATTSSTAPPEPLGEPEVRPRRAADQLRNVTARVRRRLRAAASAAMGDAAEVPGEPARVPVDAPPEPQPAAADPTSGEQRPPARLVQLGFDVAFARRPSEAETARWSTRVDGGLPAWDLVASLIAGHEVRALPSEHDAAARALFGRAYRRYLQREPSPDELDARIGHLGTGASAWSLLEAIADSAEAAARRAEVQRAQLRTVWLGFEVALGRLPSDPEIAHWLDRIDDGSMPWDLVDSLTAGVDVRARPPQREVAVRRLVDAAYRRYLRREPGPDELGTWVADLDAGASPWALLESIAGSDDATRLRDRAAQRDERQERAQLRSVWLAFEAVRRRIPTDEELAYWLARVDEGFLPWDVAASLVAGCDTRVERDAGVRDLVRAAYRRYLYRLPSDAEVARWIADLDAGASPWALLESISGADEVNAAALLQGVQNATLAASALEPLYGRGLSPAELADVKHALDTGSVGRIEFLLHAMLDHVRRSAQAEAPPPVAGAPEVLIMGTTRTISAEAWNARAREVAAEAPVAAGRPRGAPYVATGVPRVSVITSLYRGGRYIERFLEMITGQTMAPDVELIIVDANSPEGESATIERYQAAHPNIVYRRMDRRIGIYEAWNVAIGLARGEYLTNANLDDLRAEDSLERQAEVLDRYPWVDVVYQDFFYTLDDTLDFETVARFGFRSDLPIVTAANLMQYNSPHNAPMWRKRLHDQVGLFDEFLRSAGDYEFWMRCVAQGTTFFKINEPHVAYFHNPVGMSTRPDGPGYEEGMRSLRKHGRSLVSPLMFADDAAFRSALESLCGVALDGAGPVRSYDLAQQALECCWRNAAPLVGRATP